MPTQTAHSGDVEISAKALLGKQDFLFLAQDSNDLVAHLSGEVSITTGALNIIAYNTDALSRLSCRHISLIAPEAHVVYSELLPDELSVSERRPIAIALPRLGDGTVYPIEHLLELKQKGMTVYTGNDSHWTESAAFEVYSSIRSRIGRMGPFLRLYRPSPLREARDLRIPSIVDVTRREKELRKLSPSITIRLVFSNAVLNHGNVSVHLNGQGSGRCLAFGTSFSQRLVPAYVCDFREVVFCYGTAVDPTVVKMVQPDVVILEMPERFVHYPTLSVNGGVLIQCIFAAREQGYEGIDQDIEEQIPEQLHAFVATLRIRFPG